MDFLANPLHLTLLIVVIVLLFGASKLGDVGGALGKSIREFKKEAGAGDGPPKASSVPPPTSAYVPPAVNGYSSQQAPSVEPPRPTNVAPPEYRPTQPPAPAPPASSSAPPDYSGR